MSGTVPRGTFMQTIECFSTHTTGT
jgi:hypothetical protein